jgi:hypothetical protein
MLSGYPFIAYAHGVEVIPKVLLASFLILINFIFWIKFIFNNKDKWRVISRSFIFFISLLAWFTFGNILDIYFHKFISNDILRYIFLSGNLVTVFYLYFLKK